MTGSWLTFALLAAVFAALTAVFAKIGVESIEALGSNWLGVILIAAGARLVSLRS